MSKQAPFKYDIGDVVTFAGIGRGRVIAQQRYQRRPFYLVAFRLAPNLPHLCHQKELTSNKKESK